MHVYRITYGSNRSIDVVADSVANEDGHYLFRQDGELKLIVRAEWIDSILRIDARPESVPSLLVAESTSP